VNLSTETSSTSDEIELSLNNLHSIRSFKRRFTQKNVADQTDQVHCFSSSKTSLPSHESDCLDNQESESTWQKERKTFSDCVSNLNAERGKYKESLSMCFQTFSDCVSNLNAERTCKISPPHSVSRAESPDLKTVSCTDSLLTHTCTVRT